MGDRVVIGASARWTIAAHPRRTRTAVLDEAKVRATIEAIRPAIPADAGDIFLRGVNSDTGVVAVDLVGACVSCPASTVTLKAGLERILQDRIAGVTEVAHVGEPVIGETPVTMSHGLRRT